MQCTNSVCMWSTLMILCYCYNDAVRHMMSFCACNTAASQKQAGLLHRALLSRSNSSRNSSYLGLKQRCLQPSQAQPRVPMLRLAVPLSHNPTHQELRPQMKLQTNQGLLPASLPKTAPGLSPLALPHRLAVLSSLLEALLSALLRPSQ